MCSMVYAYAPPIPIVAHFEANLPPRFLTRSKPSISFPTLFQNPNFITNFTSHSSSTFTPPQLNQSSAIGALDEEIEAASFGLVGANDLLIVGPGVLGRLVAEKWREEHRECQIVGQTMTTDHHDELIKVGIDPTLKGTKGIHKFPYVIFCAPTSQTSDYPGDVSEAASLWNGEGSFLFTSSSAPYDCNDNGLCDEDTPTVQIGRSPKTDNLLKAEKVATESGGCVLRLAGLYKVDRGAHVYWLRKGTVEAHPDHILNLIHYEDAASLSVAILKKKLRGRIFLGCDNHPLSRQEVMDVVIRSGKFSKKFEGFTGTDGPLGKKLNNSKTREEIGWEPKYPSFSQFLGCSEPQSEKKQIMGIEKEILRAGTGPKPVAGKNVTVHCTGFGKNGDLSEKFWSTKDPGQKPFTFKIGQGSVIRGWDEGVMGMQVGEVARLTCSPEYGYGASGFPAWGIQPNSVLVFEIEVLKVGDWLW